ncbi:unnamed protein product [Bursaphelenchus okinawaensis]|uniref:GRAM domain-containing protein n=1 Tax=Bursaphelenchus okinawaensis TaxID=465554 RepID=A0A811KUE4_9BILA|nr:unnamed protein product [Bursaphelenchus okinawaensis]CAG9112384.1 unnamed protein product [Bursaphelenchus okinawaensis]
MFVCSEYPETSSASSEEDQDPQATPDKHRYLLKRRSTVHSVFPFTQNDAFARDHSADRREESCAQFLDMQYVPSSSPDSGNVELDEIDSASSADIRLKPCNSRWKNTKSSLDEIWSEFVDGLKDNRDNYNNTYLVDQGKLSASVLGRDIQRCLVESHFYLEFGAGLWDICTWKTPLASLCLFVVYMNCVYKEMLIPVIYCLLLLQLGINYLQTQKNIDIGLNFLPKRTVPLPKFDLNGAQLIFYVAKKAQLLLTFCADGLEKLRALFMWKKPEVTVKFVLILSFFFWLHVLTSLNTFLIVIGWLCGGKAFMMTYLYYRFPRLRQMFDIAFYFYRHLPKSPHKLTKMEKKPGSLRRRSETISEITTEHSSKWKTRLLRNNSNVTNVTVKTCNTSRQGSFDNSSESFCSSSLSAERSRDDVLFELRRPCSLIDKNQIFPKGFTQGELILNDSMLMFTYKSSKTDLVETIEMPFEQFVKIKKIRVLKTIGKLIPGGSKGIEISLKSKPKPFRFIRIRKCDEFFECLQQTAHVYNVDVSTEQ